MQLAQLDAPAHRLLNELNAVDAAMNAAASLITTLQGRRTQLFELLDHATRPESSVQAVKPMLIHRGIRYRTQYKRIWSQIDIYLYALRQLWCDFPECRIAMANALARRGTARRYVAQDRTLLFDNKSDAWIRRHSTSLVGDWYVDTNLNVERMKVLLAAAVRAAGLKWGSDVQVYWRSTPMP